MLRLPLVALLATLIPMTAFADDTVLNVAAPFEIKSADPVLSGDIFLKMDVVETLVNADVSGQPLPGLSDGWKVSADNLVWRFHIRPGVAFHDGSPLTAEAAANALNWSSKKEGVLTKAPIASISADGEEVVIALSKPFAALPAFLAEYRTGILAPAAYAADGTVTALIGTGAFKATKLEPPMTLEAVRFEGYWGGAPKLQAVQYSGISRSETRALMAEAGDAEVVVNLDPASVSRLKAVETVNVESVSLPRLLLLKVNLASPFYDTVQERKALSLAIDRAGLAQAVLRYPAAATQMFPPAMGGWHDAALAPLAYDAEAAKAAFAAAGWTPGADGVLQKDGQRFRSRVADLSGSARTAPDGRCAGTALPRHRYRRHHQRHQLIRNPRQTRRGDPSDGAVRPQLRACPRSDRNADAGLCARWRLGCHGLAERRFHRCRPENGG